MCDWIDLKLYEYLKTKNAGFAKRLDILWFLSKRVHEHQNKPGNPNENGRLHVKMVDRNIWRILKDSNIIDDFEPYEIFLLSAAACTHDFDKAQDLTIYKHGKNSADFLRLNHEFFALDKNYAKAIGSIIAIHDFKGDQFLNGLNSCSKNKTSSLGSFNLQRLALILKAADTLHVDESRINRMVLKAQGIENLGGLEKKKYLSRSCTEGWDIRNTKIIVTASPDGNEERESLYECFEWMKCNEWNPIIEYLKEYKLPFELMLNEAGGATAEIDRETTPDFPDVTRIKFITDKDTVINNNTVMNLIMILRVELQLVYEDIKEIDRISTDSSFTLEFPSDLEKEFTNIAIRKPILLMKLGIKTIVINSKEILLTEERSPVLTEEVVQKMSIQNILQEKHEELISQICKLYGDDSDNFWVVIGDKNINRSRIGGRNFFQEVNSFLNMCMYNIPSPTLLTIFHNLTIDCPEVSVFKVIYDLIINNMEES